MTLFRDKMLISHRCIHGLMPNLIKKSWTESIMYTYLSLLYLFGVDQSQCILRVPQNLKKITHSDLMFTNYVLCKRQIYVRDFFTF